MSTNTNVLVNGVSNLSANTDPLTGGNILSASNSTLKLPAGETDLSIDPDAGSSGVPVALLSNGTVAANGQITLVTALPSIYGAPLGVWGYLPAGAISGGAAGFYWMVFTSTTVGQVYSLTVPYSTAVDFSAYVPSVALTAAVGSGVAYTQTTGSAIRLCNVTIQAGSMGVGGWLDYNGLYTGNIGAAGARTLAWGLGGTTYGTTLLLQASFGSGRLIQRLQNRGVTNSQVAHHNALSPNTGIANTSYYTSETTTNDLRAYLTAQLATATDCIVLECFSVRIQAKNS